MSNSFRTTGIVVRGAASVVLANLMLKAANDSCPARSVALDEKFSFNRAAFREQPLKLMQRHQGHPRFGSEEEIVGKVLDFCLPRFSPPTVGLAIHEAALWQLGGVDVELPEDCRVKYSGHIVDELLDQRITRSGFTGGGESQLIEPSSYGLHVNLAYFDLDAEKPTEFHFGQFLMAMGIAGVPTSRSVVGLHRAGTLLDVLHDLQMNFSFDHELEFAAIALAHYLPPQSSWSSQYNDEYCFDSLMARLVEVSCGQGACHGVHVPIAVSVLLAADRQYDVLCNKAEALGHQYLRNVSLLLQRNEHSSRGWTDWEGTSECQFPGSVSHLEHLTVTGHHLEWISISDPRDCPNRQIIERAIKSLQGDIEALTATIARSFKPQLPATHAARALLILSGNNDPFSCVSNLN